MRQLPETKERSARQQNDGTWRGASTAPLGNVLSHAEQKQVLEIITCKCAAQRDGTHVLRLEPGLWHGLSCSCWRVGFVKRQKTHFNENKGKALRQGRTEYASGVVRGMGLSGPSGS